MWKRVQLEDSISIGVRSSHKVHAQLEGLNRLMRNHTGEEPEPAPAPARDDIVDKGGKVTSPVWQYFGYFKSDNSRTHVVCKLSKVVVSTNSGNTTNLFYHLSLSHPLEYSNVKQPQP